MQTKGDLGVEIIGLVSTPIFYDEKN